MLIKTFKTMAPFLFKARVTPLLVGQTGIGKSQLVEQLGKDLGFDRVLSFKLGNLQDQADLLGLMEFIKDPQGKTRTTYARPDFWPMDPKEKVLIFFDELNRANRQLVQPIMELALEFKHHDYNLPEGCRVIAAMNPATVDYQTNDISDAALMDRFCQIKITPSSDEWASYMRTKLSDNKHGLIQFFAQNEKALRGEMVDFSLEIKPSHRKVSTLLSEIEPQNPPTEVLQEIAIGLLGAGPAVAFMEHYRTAEQPLGAKDILDSFKEHQEAFKAHSDGATRRSDLINAAVTGLIEFFNVGDADSIKLKAAQKANLCAFLRTIPADSAWHFCDKALEKNHKLLDVVIMADAELCARLQTVKADAKTKEA